MKKTSPIVTIIMGIAVMTFLLLSSAKVKSNPSGDKGWFPAGSHPKEYQMEITSSMKHTGSHCAMIKYVSTGAPSGFGTFMQMHKPGAWAGKKLKMTGYVKTENVADWCGMWCRVDGADGKEMVDFDNMQDRPLKGSTDWTKCEITINVTKDASAIAYGVLVSGKGAAYFDDISFEVIGDADPHPKSKMSGTDKPTNLNFED